MTEDKAILEALNKINRNLSALVILSGQSYEDNDERIDALSRAGFSSREIARIVGLDDSHIRSKLRGGRKSK